MFHNWSTASAVLRHGHTVPALQRERNKATSTWMEMVAEALWILTQWLSPGTAKLELLAYDATRICFRYNMHPCIWFINGSWSD